MSTRTELQSKLEAIMVGLGYSDADKRVYFQPPANHILKYPCIIYKLEGDQKLKADDRTYTRRKRYGITAISKDPDSPLQDVLLGLPYCALGNVFTTDNLYHYCYTIYY